MLLTVSASSVTKVQNRKLLFYIGLYITSIGKGGHKPCIQTFAADQFNESSPEELIAKASFFNWWYLGIVIGALSSSLVVTYVQVHYIHFIINSFCPIKVVEKRGEG